MLSMTHHAKKKLWFSNDFVMYYGCESQAGVALTNSLELAVSLISYSENRQSAGGFPENQ
jgi:hypothetical protein